MASSMASISSEAACLGASAVEVEGHVSAPEWRLLFLGSGCNNNYVYTERSSSGIQLPYSMYRWQIRP